jgi:hypothetical protein
MGEKSNSRTDSGYLRREAPVKWRKLYKKEICNSCSPESIYRWGD